MKVTQLCPNLCDPMDYIVHGILQARILEWVAFPFSRGSSQPRDQTQVSCTAGGFLTSWATREAQEHWRGSPLPSPGDLLNPGMEPRFPALQEDSLADEPLGKPKNTGVGRLCLLQGIFLTQESNHSLLHCRWFLYQSSHQVSSWIKNNLMKKHWFLDYSGSSYTTVYNSWNT